MSGGYERSRQKADELRAQLQPLGPDERPLGLKLGAALATVIAVANLVLAATGETVAGGVLFAAVMGLLAYGLWQRKYAVVVVFEALLALTIIVATVSLPFAGNLFAVVLCVGLIAICAPIFWLLVRVMARLQVPDR